MYILIYHFQASSIIQCLNRLQTIQKKGMFNTHVQSWHCPLLVYYRTTRQFPLVFMCLAGAVANVADSDRCRCNPKVPSSIPAGGKDFP